MAMESTFGLMEACIKEILSMELGMAMEYGLIKIKHKDTQDAIEWIKNRGLGSMNGQESKCTKDNSEKILGKVLEDYINMVLNWLHNLLKRVEHFKKKLFIKECGIKANKSKTQQQINRL